MGGAEPILPDFDYKHDVTVQQAILYETKQHVRPINEPSRGTEIVFDIDASTAFTSLHQSKLVVEVKVTKENKVDCNHAATENPDKVTVVNNMFHSMWKSVSIKLNGHNVETVSNYPYRAYIDTLTSFSKEVMDTRGLMTGWAKDTAGKMNVAETGGLNVGANNRGKMIESSKTYKMKGRLHTDVWLQGRSIPPGTSITVTLTPNEDKFVLLAPANTKYELHIERAYLEVVRQHVPLSLTSSVAAYKNNKPLSLNYRKVCVTTHNIKENFVTAQLKLFESESALPDRFLVCFIDHLASAGSIDKNPFNFENFGVKSLYIDLNDDAQPGQKYSPNFERNVVDEYLALLEELGADEDNHIINITPEDFSLGYAIFPFRLVPRTSGGECLGPQKTGTVQLNVEFKSALTKVLTVVTLAEYRSKLVFKASGDISTAK